MDLTVQNVYGLLIRSKLLPLDDARAMYDRWNKEAKDAATNVAQFARWMVANRYLTEYQASLLARGHADGFFLGAYKVLDRLGKGRMAGVYKAQHETGPVVAIKVLPPSKARDAALRGRFQREARLALKLRHPNVVRTYQVGEGMLPDTKDRLHYLVMEYIEGETLEDVLQRRRQFPPAEAVRIIYQALRGLQHLHEHGTVHRDLKPANLMLAYPSSDTPRDTLTATVKILDMGLARALSDEVAPDRGAEPAPVLTSEGLLLGTPDYMAPEQARDARHADVRADIYSLGCVLYHLLDGKPPFPDTNIISQMIRHATETPKPLKEGNPSVPDGLQQIINWMLAKDPAKRYQTPERAAQALQVFLAAGAEQARDPEADPKMKQFLTWLEIDIREQAKKVEERKQKKAQPKPGEAAKPATPGVPPPLAIPMPGVAPAATMAPGTDKMPALPAERAGARAAKAERARAKAAAARRKARKARKSHGQLQLPMAQQATPTAAPAVPMQPPQIDVELVTIPPPQPQKAFGIPLTRRDFVMFSLGVSTVVVGTGLGLLGAWIAGAFKKKDPPVEP